MRNRAFPTAMSILAGSIACMTGLVAHAARPAHGAHAVAVSLTRQPGTALDDAARGLVAHDIAQSAGSGEPPLVLVGAATLATRSGSAKALFVQLQSAQLCGSAGCDTSVYLPVQGGWTKVLDSVSGPIVVLPASHGHMRDLMVGEHDRWVWAGHAYRDTMTAPALTGLKRSVERHEQAVERNGGVSPPPR